MQGAVKREVVEREESGASMVKRNALRSPKENRPSYAPKDTETRECKVKNTDTKDRNIETKVKSNNYSELSDSDDCENEGVKKIVKNKKTEKTEEKRRISSGTDDFLASDSEEKVERKEENNLKCFKCDKACNSAPNLRNHILSHYYEVFFAVLPASKPLSCPDCNYNNVRDKITLVRHYALCHNKLFEMTDVTPEQAQCTLKGRSRKRRSSFEMTDATPEQAQCTLKGSSRKKRSSFEMTDATPEQAQCTLKGRSRKKRSSFEMTDATPEQAQCTLKGRSRKRRSKGDLLFSFSFVSVQILNFAYTVL